jgi:RNA polymerase sigma factor (sigma-70 family)
VDELQELLTRYRAGDRDALEALLAHLRREAARWLEFHERRLPSEVRDDIVQQAIETMWQSIPQVRGETARELRAYFRRVLHCKIIDAARKRDAERRKLDALEGDSEPARRHRSDGGLSTPGPEDAVNDNVESARLQEMLHGVLSELEFHAFTLKLQGYKDREIAVILRVHIGTVATALSRARQKLRKVFSEHGMVVKKPPATLRPEDKDGTLGAGDA